MGRALSQAVEHGVKCPRQTADFVAPARGWQREIEIAMGYCAGYSSQVAQRAQHAGGDVAKEGQLDQQNAEGQTEDGKHFCLHGVGYRIGKLV